jgi:hypothetical protein
MTMPTDGFCAPMNLPLVRIAVVLCGRLMPRLP